MTIGLLIHQYFASKKSFWFCRSIVLCVLVDDDNDTGCSGASASTGTLVTTNHLLLITFLAVWKEISNMHTKGKKKDPFYGLSAVGERILDSWKFT